MKSSYCQILQFFGSSFILLALLLWPPVPANGFDPDQLRQRMQSLPKTLTKVPVANVNVPLKLMDIPVSLRDLPLYLDCVVVTFDDDERSGMAFGRKIADQVLTNGAYQGTITVSVDELYGRRGSNPIGQCIASINNNNTCIVLSVSGQVNSQAGLSTPCGENLFFELMGQPVNPL